MPRKKKLPPPPAKNETPGPLHYVIRWNQRSYVDDGFRKFLRRMIEKEEADLDASLEEYNKRRDEMFKRAQWRRDRIDEIWAEIEKPLLSGTIQDDLWDEYRTLTKEMGKDSYGSDPWLIRSRELSDAKLFLCHMDSIDATTKFYKCVERMGRDKKVSQQLGEIPWASLN